MEKGEYDIFKLLNISYKKIMRLSQAGLGTMRINNLDEMFPVQDILLQTGQLVQYGTGIYGYGTVCLKVKQNIEEIIRENLNKAGCIEVELPTLQPSEIWKQSGRYEKYQKENVMLEVKSNKGDFCLAPTAEEAVVVFAKGKLKSYKHLPVIYYQIGEKYRNELRNRGYLLRGKSFLMMDGYSFDTSKENMAKSYDRVRNAYLNIAKELELEVVPVIADNGDMGGKRSEEFMVISPFGEDTILYDEKTKIGINKEVLEKENYEEYLKDEYGVSDISEFKEVKAVEIGHIFQLGTRYSESMEGKFIDKDGKEKPYYMGCYGIGVSRLVATIYEKSVIKNQEGKVEGFSLPTSINPYDMYIIYSKKDERKKEFAQKLYTVLGGQAIIDDRENISVGESIKDAKVLGPEFIIIVGDKTPNDMVEIEDLRNNKKQVITYQHFLDTILTSKLITSRIGRV